jgi:hypothetical protein
MTVWTCGAPVDLRDLGQVMAHIHGQEIETLLEPSICRR